MLRALIIVGSVTLVMSVSAVGYLVLQACAVVLPFGWQLPGACRDAGVLSELETLDGDNEALRREILMLERRLGAVQCEADYSGIESVPELPASVEPQIEATRPSQPEDEIDADAWEAGDVGLLEGCWELDSDIRVQDVDTGTYTHFNQWNMCFDASGQGRETMQATNGTSCEGTVSGQFRTTGRLAISEPGNLMCSDGSYIYQRDLDCSLSADGLASCAVRQPELQRNSTVRLRRAAIGGL